MTHPTTLGLLLVLGLTGACDRAGTSAGRRDPVEPPAGPSLQELSDEQRQRVAAAERALGVERPAEVETALRPLLELPSPPPVARFLLGWAHYQMQHYGECVEHIEAAIAADPSLAGKARVLGFAHYKLGDYPAARSAFEAFLEAHPEDHRARYGLGLSELALGEHALAEPHLRAALADQPGYAKAHYALARLYDETGRAAEALPHLEFVLERERFHVEALYLLGQVQKALGDDAAALATLERWREAYAARERLGPLQQRVREGRAGPEVFLELMRQHMLLGDPEQAEAIRAEGVRLYPDQPGLLRPLR